jgi:hypothetical protein
MAKVPLPETLPGDFFVASYNEDTEEYTLHLDDGRGSSFRVGNVAEAMLTLSRWGVEKLLAGRALDYAREFKAPVQCIPEQGRAISLRNKDDDRVLVFDGDNKVNWVHSV